MSTSYSESKFSAPDAVFIMNYVQAHRLDLDFYDRFFKPGAYLRTEAEHTQRGHAGPEGG